MSLRTMTFRRYRCNIEELRWVGGGTFMFNLNRKHIETHESLSSLERPRPIANPETIGTSDTQTVVLKYHILPKETKVS